MNQELKENGYTIVPDVLTSEEVEQAKEMFYTWKDTVPNHDLIHKQCDPHGIYKYNQAGHQEFAWFIRTRPAVKKVFADIWETDELTVSFDGSCYISKDIQGTDDFWCHSDQSPKYNELKCYQGFVSLTDNIERSLVVWDKTHLMHHDYFSQLGREKDSSNWQRIPKEDEDKLLPYKKVLPVTAGSMVLWDSRLFHQNQYGETPEERIVQYVCMLPKNVKENSTAQKTKRQLYFYTKRMTSHWPYPIRVNALQPRHWGNEELMIDYNKLVVPNLTPYMTEIQELIH
jgi:hypothetical protein|tara:strand:- start:2023 stop:2880 length:858 start_codon:yes stop_codon:yes gene_type:complete